MNEHGPDGHEGTSPFRGEKGLCWEGGFRAPLIIRWPGKIAPSQVLNGIISLEGLARPRRPSWLNPNVTVVTPYG